MSDDSPQGKAAPAPITPPSERKRGDGAIGKALWLSVQLVWDMGWIIAIPAVVLGFSGASLDKHTGTSPLFLLLGLAIALLLSAVGIVRKLKAIVQRRF